LRQTTLVDAGHSSAVSASRSARSALPRWLIAFFSAIDSSAMLSPPVSSGRNTGSYPNPPVPRGEKPI